MAYLPDKLAPSQPSPEITPQQVLLDAANILRTQGWCQLQTLNKQGEMCAIGAINYALGRNPGSVLTATAYQAIALLGKDMFRLVIWNDSQGRTKQEVIDAFEVAAKR